MILEEKRNEFIALFNEFVREYLLRPKGQEHLPRYEDGRTQGRRNFDEIREEAVRSGVPTDKVLKQLLPHTDSLAHRNSGAWIHIAPVIQGEIKNWFEAAGWAQSADWPNIADKILTFITRSVDGPSTIESTCGDFVNSDFSTGLQTGLLTPILNAVRPAEFLIVNSKSRAVINYFTGHSFKQRLTDYPAVNNAGRTLITEMQNHMREASGSDAPSADLFDMFCHWLAAEKKYAPISTRGGRVRVPGGEVTVTIPDDDDELTIEQPDIVASEARESHRIQGAIAEVGAKMGFKIWIPRNDRSRVFQHCPEVRSQILDELPLNYIDVTLKTIEQIDVIWLKRHSIARAFEVEHTTAIYSGLLRMADLLSLQPDLNIRLHIVAPDDKHDKVMREIRRPIFSSLEKAPLYQRCSFISYSSVTELRNLRQLEYMTDSVLTQYEEFAEEE